MIRLKLPIATGLACTSKYYEDKGYFGHVNCSDNFTAQLEPYTQYWSTWRPQAPCAPISTLVARLRATGLAET